MYKIYTLNLVILHIDITMFRVYNNINIKQNNQSNNASNRVARKVFTNLKQYTCELVAIVKAIVRKIL